MLLILFWIFPSNGVKVSNVELNFISKEDFHKEKLITKVAAVRFQLQLLLIMILLKGKKTHSR